MVGNRPPMRVFIIPILQPKINILVFRALEVHPQVDEAAVPWVEVLASSEKGGQVLRGMPNHNILPPGCRIVLGTGDLLRSSMALGIYGETNDLRNKSRNLEPR